MRNWRMIFLAALMGLQLFFVHPLQAQEACRFQNPIEGTSGPTGQIAFGAPNSFDYNGSHTGNDWLAPAGTPVMVAADGEVIFVGDWPSWTTGAWANSVQLKIECGGQTLFVQYVHLWDGRYSVSVGDRVRVGQIVGFVGPIAESGFGDADHVHVNVIPNDPREVESGSLGLDQVVWLDPTGFFGPMGSGSAPSRSASNSSSTLVVGGVGVMILIGVIVLAIASPRTAVRGAKAAVRGFKWMFEKSIETLYWLYVALIELPFGEGKFFRAALVSGIFAGLLIVIPLTGLAILSVTTGGGRVEAVRLSFPVQSRPSGQISTIFTPEIQAWTPKIVEWSRMYDLDKNLIATVMQIESCGDASAESPSGAQGLFQVMPFHFASGEDMQDPDTNARRGMEYLQQTIAAYPDDAGRALSAYNGGIAGVSGDISLWANETQKYWYWSTGIFADAQSGVKESTRLAEWLAVDAGYLCRSSR